MCAPPLLDLLLNTPGRSQFAQQLVLKTAASAAGGGGRSVTLQAANADEADAWRRSIEAAIDV